MFKKTQPAGILLAILAGCAHAATPVGPAPGAPGGPPAWIMQLPSEKSYVYAVGVSGPTFDPNDASKSAGDNGRVALAHVLSSHVTSATLAINSTGGNSDMDSAAVVDATHDYTDAIVQNSEVISTWVDHTGAYSSGQAGTAYALLRMNLATVTANAPAKPAATPVSAQTTP